jgi:hypothetical protein
MAAELALLTKIGEGFIKDVYGALKNKAVEKWQTFNWHTAQIHYFKKIEADYGTTRILGNPEPIPLEGIFTDVFLLDMPTAYKRFNILQLQNEPELINSQQKRLSGLDLVKSGELHRLYILGKPGAGKTTFLKYVALKAAQQEIRKIPIFVSLKEWADSGIELMPFLIKQFNICDFPESQPLIEYLLELGLAIVLFDGLDETQQEGGKRDEIINNIRDFSRKYDKSQVLVTCRIAATDYTFEKFTYLEVADFTEEQVDCYVEKWFSYDEEKQKQFKKEFAIKENERLREMASTPLLLSLLCLNFEQTGYFPQRRVDIYEEGINALLTRWDASRNIRRDGIYKGLELGRKRQMFARIAAQTFDKNEYFVPKNKLIEMITEYLCKLPNSPSKEDIDGEAVLKAIEAQHSILVERAQGIYSFSHLSFQEYFTSKYIVENVADGTLEQLLKFVNISDNRWHEVVLNVASLLDEADSYFGIMQKSIDSIVFENNKINSLLRWAEQKTIKVSNNNRLIERCAYLRINNEVDSFNLQLYGFGDYIAEHDSKRLEFTDFTKMLKMMIGDLEILSENEELFYELQFISESSFFDSDSYLILDYEIVFVYLLSFVIARDVITDKNIYSYLKKFRKTFLENSRNIDNEYFKTINNLRLPRIGESKKIWNKFVNDFLILSQKHRNIPYITNFDPESIKTYTKILIATDLLFRSLKLAVVSNRQKIEEKLLLPVNSNS